MKRLALALASALVLLLAPGGCSSIHEAAKKGDVERVRALLQEGVPVYRTNDVGQTALHMAARKGHLEVAKLLVSRGAEADAVDSFGFTPLDEAALRGHKDIVALLLAKGGIPHNPAHCLGSALDKAASEGHKEIVALLLTEWPFLEVRRGGLDALYYAVYVAAYDGHKDVVALLIDKAENAEPGVDIERGVDRDELYNEPLGVAACFGYKDIVEFLIDKGADINAQDEGGPTPLQEAAFGGHREIAELLIAKGANVNAKDNSGHTPLLSGMRHKDIVALLIAKGADVNARCSEFGWTPLHYAASSGKLRLYKNSMELLIAAGADVNAPDHLGRTPLDLAISKASELDEWFDLNSEVIHEHEKDPEQVKDERAMIEFLKQHGGRTLSRAEQEGDGRFDGTWHSPEEKYTFKIEGREGVAVLSNSSEYDAGYTIFWVYTFNGNTFTGTQMFADGRWRDVVGELKNGVLHMKGDGRTWTMTRLSVPAEDSIRSGK